ncbi:MAG: hypothetical protein WA459_18955 [Stellaceae bacterium]
MTGLTAPQSPDGDGVPVATDNCGSSRKDPRHWLEYAAVALASLAFLASSFAAGFSGWQAWIARDTEQRELRAYLELTDIEVVCPDCTTVGPVSPTRYPGRNFIHIRFENAGQTPARAIRFKTNWWVIPSKDAPLPKIFEFPDYSPSGVVPAGATNIVSTSELARDKHREGNGPIDHDIARFRAATNATSTIYLYGHLDYCDVFGKPRETGFCFLYVPKIGEKLPICDQYNGEIVAHHKRS